MTLHSEVKLYGAELQPGETIREICPLCGGGSSKEKSLVITRGDNGGLKYICHRASCDSKGNTDSVGVLRSETIAKPKKVRKRFTGTTTPLSNLHTDLIRSLWGISEYRYWYWTNDLGGRLAMSIRSPKYTHRGWVMRDIRGRSAIKALTYLDEGEESLSWYKLHKDRPTVLVEDIPSAVRASPYVNSVALLGTGVGLSKASEIEQYATRPIIVALDQDATPDAFRIARRYTALWGDTQIIMLDKDIKDMKEKDIEELFTT